jgi:hypothetical protein
VCLVASAAAGAVDEAAPRAPPHAPPAREEEEAPLDALTQHEAEAWLAGVTARVLAAAPPRVAVRASCARFSLSARSFF